MKLGILLVILWMNSTCLAEWEAWSPSMLVNKTDLIGTGVLGDVKRTVSNNTVRCGGTIRFNEMFKGTNAVVTVKWGFSVPPVEDAMDHTSLEGKQLLWFLKRNKDGSFTVPHMDGVQSISRAAEFRAIIKGSPNQVPDTALKLADPGC